MADYRDPEPLSPAEPDYEQSKVDKRVRTYADHVRYKIYGVDVREADVYKRQVHWLAELAHSCLN